MSRVSAIEARAMIVRGFIEPITAKEP